MNFELPRHRAILLDCTALFAMLWAIARACVQAVTLDEADSYLGHVQPAWPSHWWPSANNHVLNSMLMRLFTSVFGLSHLTVRAPALIGAALYISAAYCFCRLIARDSKLQWPLFVCLVYNPFIFDFLVAARGYSLALAFLLWAIGIPAYFIWENMNGRAKSMYAACALSSLCAGLSFTANFSFAFVNCAALAIVLFWACRSTEGKIASYAKLLGACSLPALLVAFFLCTPVLLHFPARDLSYGATSLRETVSTIVDASFFELNPYFVHPLLAEVLTRLRPVVMPLLGVLCVYQFVMLLVHRARVTDIHTKWISMLGCALTAVIILSISVHWLAFRFFHLLLPKDRTGIYLVPLCTLAAGILAAVPAPGIGGRFGRIGLNAQLFVLSAFFLLCMRLNYFKEWRYDADVKNVYSVLAYYNHAYGIKEMASNWMYIPSLNLYRLMSGHETISKFAITSPYPECLLYVLYDPDDHPFIEEHKLKVAYHGDLTDVVVAIKPEAELRPSTP